jgi:hypothetical protein
MFFFFWIIISALRYLNTLYPYLRFFSIIPTVFLTFIFILFIPLCIILNNNNTSFRSVIPCEITLQQEDGSCWTKTCSSINEENSCAQLRTVIYINQYWLTIFTLGQILTKHIFWVLSSLTDPREFRISVKLPMPSLWACAICHHASELQCLNPQCVLK